MKLLVHFSHQYSKISLKSTCPSAQAAQPNHGVQAAQPNQGAQAAEPNQGAQAAQPNHGAAHGGVIQGRNGTKWQKIAVSSASQGRLQSHNILRCRPGSTSYATRHVFSGSPVSSFRILFDEAMLRGIQKCTVVEGHAQTGEPTWNVTLQELDKFVGLVIARGVIGGSNFPLKTLWGKSWRCLMFSQCRGIDLWKS